MKVLEAREPRESGAEVKKAIDEGPAVIKEALGLEVIHSDRADRIKNLLRDRNPLGYAEAIEALRQEIQDHKSGERFSTSMRALAKVG